MGHVGLTCPYLLHRCTLSLVLRLTLTITHRKTKVEGKIHSDLINLGPGTYPHKHKCMHEVTISCTYAQSVCVSIQELGLEMQFTQMLKLTYNTLFS